LSNYAGELRGGFDQQHAGKQGLTGKMAAQKRLVAANEIFADASLAGFQIQQAIYETEFRSVGQGGQGSGQVVVHFL
jgi:hypothetical protein